MCPEVERLRAELAAARVSAEKAEATVVKEIAAGTYALAQELVAAIARAEKAEAALKKFVGDKPMSVGEFNARADAGEAWLSSRGFYDVPGWRK